VRRYRWIPPKVRRRREEIKKAIEEKREKVPRAFLHEYLSSKGWRESNVAICYDCNEETEVHPVKFLWRHVLKGCKPCFDSSHTWTRQVGRYGKEEGNVEEWFGWYFHSWDPESGGFVREVQDKGYE